MTVNHSRALGSRTLGSAAHHSDLQVSTVGLGCMGMSEFYGSADESEAVRTIHRALDLGVTLLDTADMYGPFTTRSSSARDFRPTRRGGAGHQVRQCP